MKRQRQKLRQGATPSPPAPSVAKRMPSLRATVTALVLIIVTGLLVYSNTFNAPFEYDDAPNILNNPFVRITRVDTHAFKGVFNSRVHRPFPYLTIALNYYFHQYDVTGFHVVNLAIHLMTAFLVFLITRQTLRLCRSDKTWIAIPAALLWLVNPVHTQSVTYIVQRMNAMAAMFYLLAMVCYIQGRLIQRRDKNARLRPVLLFFAAALAGLLGLGSKEIVATLPVMIFLYEWYFFQNLDRGWLRRQARWAMILFTISAAVVLIYLKDYSLAQFSSKYDKLDFTMAQRLLTEPGVVLYYLSLLFYPSPGRLMLLYDFPVVKSLLSIPGLLSVTALAGLVIVALFSRHRNRLVSFAIAWFLINLVIESSVYPLALVFEHRTYLPSIFLFIALVDLIFKKATAKKALFVMFPAIIICGFWTWQRNVTWEDSVSFWTDAVKKAPDSNEAQHDLGGAFSDKGEKEEALMHFKAALALNDKTEKTYICIGSMLVSMNRAAEAIPYLETAIRINNQDADAYYNLGVAYEILGETKKAESNYTTVLELNPLYAQAYDSLGVILMNRGQADDAIVHFKRALRINPFFTKPYKHMGITYFQKGKTDRALASFKKALAINPDDEEAAGNLDMATRIMKQYGQTIARLQQAHRRHPDDPDIAFQLATVCQEANMTDLAVDLYQQALTLNPECEACLDALTRIFIAAGRYKRAAGMLERMVQFHPDNPNFYYGLARAYARDNRKEKAVAALKKAVENGFKDIQYIGIDKNLESIRDTDYFKTLTAGREK